MQTRPVVVLVDGPGEGEWWTPTTAALTTAGIPLRRVVVPLPDRVSGTLDAPAVAAITQALDGLLAERVVLVGAGYAATAIAWYLSAGARAGVSHAVLVEPAGARGPSRTPLDDLSLAGLGVPVFVARSREPATTARDGVLQTDGNAGAGVFLRVYPMLSGPHGDPSEFVDDLFDFIGATPASAE